MKIEEIKHGEYGRCLQFSNASATLVVTLDYGPRIIHYALLEHLNVMFFNRDPSYRKSGPDFDRVFYKDAYWDIRGGNRLWIAPHSFPHAFYPDNEPVTYELFEGGARFTPPPRTRIGAQLETEVRLAAESAEVSIRHSVRNIAATPKSWSAWSITSVDAGGVEVIPMSQSQTGVLPNKHIAFWPYTNLCDTRLSLGNKYSLVRHDSANSAQLKIGFNNEESWASYLVHNQCFTLRFSAVENGEYPDFGVNYETFEDDRMVEMEALSPMKKLQQGEFVSLKETWNLRALPREIDLKETERIAEAAAKLCQSRGENL